MTEQQEQELIAFSLDPSRSVLERKKILDWILELQAAAETHPVWANDKAQRLIAQYTKRSA